MFINKTLYSKAFRNFVPYEHLSDIEEGALYYALTFAKNNSSFKNVSKINYYFFTVYALYTDWTVPFCKHAHDMRFALYVLQYHDYLYLLIILMSLKENTILHFYDKVFQLNMIWYWFVFVYKPKFALRVLELFQLVESILANLHKENCHADGNVVLVYIYLEKKIQ